MTSPVDWMREADQVIRRSQAILDRLARPAGPPAARPDGPCRNLRAKSADLESALFQWLAASIVR
jgi:hypothetical protein